MLGRLFIDAVYYFPPIFECMTINDTIHRRIDLERQEIQKQSSMCLRRDVQNLVQRVIYAATLIFSAVFFSPRPVDTPSPIFFFGLQIPIQNFSMFQNLQSPDQQEKTMKKISLNTSLLPNLNRKKIVENSMYG